MNRVTLGGERLGAGKKMQVDLHGYERATFNLNYKLRTSMSAGTLVPFMKLVAQPGDTFDIELDADIQTHPTVGPLFGSFKGQWDVFFVPWRLYNSYLHNNKAGIGMEMNKVLFPVIELTPGQADLADAADIDNAQINPSCILAYLGIRGIGSNDLDPAITRRFNGTAILGYWDIVKNYYANLMEKQAYVIHNGANAGGAVTDVLINGAALPQPANGSSVYVGSGQDLIEINWTTPGSAPNLDYVLIQVYNGNTTLWVSAANLGVNWIADTSGATDVWRGQFNATKYGQLSVMTWRIAGATDGVQVEPRLTAFPIENIDEMREAVLAWQSKTTPFVINTFPNEPYSLIATTGGPNADLLASQEGLAVKTYQSDLFNNWLNTEYIDGVNGINEITRIDTTGDSFTINQLILGKKVYDLMNRVAVSGGSYRDWIKAVYDDNKPWVAETPVYEGSLIKELVFQEVISNSQSETQPLGTLGGRGVLTNKHKGGYIQIRVDEPGYIMGIQSLTPRVEYSQGNDWDMYEIMTMDDLHKPGMDGIGFEDSIQEQRAWWSTHANSLVPGNEWVQKSAGKVPAWINYMTSVDKVLGNFAIADNEMFMTLNRRYEYNGSTDAIKDMTTYIDPAKYNYIFAQTSLDAQNFWVSTGVRVEKRSKMSAKIMPNL